MTKKNNKKDNTDNIENPSNTSGMSGTIAELEKEISDLKVGWQRTQADFDNYQKRSEDQKLNIITSANTDLMLKITPVLDNFSRAFLHAPKKDNFVLGIKQIEKQLEEILVAEGLEKIQAKAGTKFDPTMHEAISYEENDLPTDKIIAEVETGWIFRGKVLKPTKVRVSKGK